MKEEHQREEKGVPGRVKTEDESHVMNTLKIANVPGTRERTALQLIKPRK